MPAVKPKAIDLFSGCGGLTQGLRDAGFRVLAGVEFDELAAASYRRNHRRVVVFQEDIRDLRPIQFRRQFRLERGELDLLAGCPPCQAFSSMRCLNGSRRTRDKDSKDLVLEFLRFVRGLLPKVIMIENVPRLASDRRIRDVQRQLHDLGYEGEPAVLNAADFGVPQRRRRMIYIASRIGPIPCAGPLPPGAERTVWDAIHGLPRPGRSGDPPHDLPEERSERIKALIRRIPRNGGSRRSLGEDEQLECHRNCDGFNDVYGRMAWRNVSPTITSGCTNPSKGRFLHPSQNRAITLREAALLQGFPRNYYFSLERGKCAAALLIGNAFPPAFVRLHAEIIRASLREYNRT